MTKYVLNILVFIWYSCLFLTKTHNSAIIGRKRRNQAIQLRYVGQNPEMVTLIICALWLAKLIKCNMFSIERWRVWWWRWRWQCRRGVWLWEQGEDEGPHQQKITERKSGKINRTQWGGAREENQPQVQVFSTFTKYVYILQIEGFWLIWIEFHPVVITYFNQLGELVNHDTQKRPHTF